MTDDSPAVDDALNARKMLVGQATELEQKVDEAQALIREGESRVPFLGEAGSVLSSSLLYSGEREARRAAEDSAARARLLQSVMAALAQAVTPKEVAEAALSYGTSALGASNGAMYQLSSDGSELTLLKAVGLTPATVDQFQSFRVDALLPLSEAIRSGATIYLESREDTVARYPALREVNEITSMPSWAISPLVVAGRPLGGVAFGFAVGTSFTAADREFIATLTHQLAQALERSRLYQGEREARESAQAANRAKSDFLATMSHELRTPINAIQGYAQLLDLGIPGPITDQQRDYLGRLTSSADHLLGLVNEVLDLAKIESGAIRVNVEPTAAGGTVDAALSLVRPQAGAKGIALSEQCEGARDSCYVGDEHRVRQIMTNLLSNAVKFTQPGGKVSVDCTLIAEPGEHLKLKHGTPYILFRVTDTGSGIEADQIERIFEPFTQGEAGRKSTYTRGTGGTGLGLTISRRLARLMGGELAVESTPGIGSEFKLFVPSFEPSRHSGHGQASFIGGHEAPYTEMPMPDHPASERRPRVRRGRGLAQIGDGLVASAGAVVDSWLAKMRDAPGFTHDEEIGVTELQDHAATFVADMGLALRVLDDTDGEPSAVLRDGSAIMRTIAEQHGGQRCRIGWSEQMIETEMSLLADATSSAIRRIAGPDGHPQADEANAIISQFIAQGTRYSVASFRFASSMNTQHNPDSGVPADPQDLDIVQPS